MKYLIANWKAEIDDKHMEAWCESFHALLKENGDSENNIFEKVSIILCPPFPYLSVIKDYFADFPTIYVGAQTVSRVKEGKFTGEVTAKALSALCSHVIIGHSERRNSFGETENDIKLKLTNTKDEGLSSILCVRSSADRVYQEADMIAYEPVGAIGTGANASLADILSIRKTLDVPDDKPFLYGGSVDPETIEEYLATDVIHGFLVGSASLDPHAFFLMAQKMS